MKNRIFTVRVGPKVLVEESSIFRFLRGPMAAKAVLLASCRLNSSLSAWITWFIEINHKNLLNESKYGNMSIQ